MTVKQCITTSVRCELSPGGGLISSVVGGAGMPPTTEVALSGALKAE